MRLLVNGENYDVAAAAGITVTITTLLAELGLSGPVAVEVNRDIVPRSQHASHTLRAGDTVEIVHLVGGG